MSQTFASHPAQAGERLLGLLDDVLGRAARAGAEAADAVTFETTSLAVSQRLGKREDIERSESSDLGLRVFVGQGQGVVSSSDTASATLDEMVARAVAMARAAPEDPHAGLAETNLLARDIADLDLFDASEQEAETLYARAAEAEDAARAIEGVSNSEGAEASWGMSAVALATSHGFRGHYLASRQSVSVSVLAGQGTGMERDYDFASARFGDDLDDPAAIGASAGRRAVARLDPRQVETTQVPVIYDPRVANGLVRHLASAISGPSVARGSSFLKDRMGERLFRPAVRVVDDPHRRRGLASKPFDGEGVANRRTTIIEKGLLKTWLLDRASAHQLGLTSSGHASRGTSTPPSPSPTNLYLEAGAKSPAELMASIEQGFYVNELIGFGINYVTGDYSRGAAGFWIENGEIAYPVSEVTVAGNLADMFAALEAADDLEFRYGVNSPTVRIDGMTVAGA
ncbi:MAG TPA: metallopeptidase TldD-related protein [Alphaproteobacteria bacterium]|jgi:PmbA protein|nr:metallopeptidase TldD-related protein [Alphaproteobacteria bacterium]HJM49783.1 metallopeptidase TldD-related protein [Alphaproteobacteria bacterium]